MPVSGVNNTRDTQMNDVFLTRGEGLAQKAKIILIGCVREMVNDF